MRTIHKYEIPQTRESVIEMPRGAQLLSVGVDGRDALCVWVECYDQTPLVSRAFYVSGTGWSLDGRPHSRFIGTVVTKTGYVWHVYEVLVAPSPTVDGQERGS